MVHLRPKSTSAAALVPGAVDSFPLPDERIPKVQLSESEVRSYRNLTHELVTNTLAKEMAFRYDEAETLDSRRWKFVKAKERMRVYKRTANSSGKLAPRVLGVGFIEGTIENALYGLHHKTTLEMRTTSAYINPNILDAAVLANLEVGTPDDPFRYLGLKWRVARTPGGHLVKNRDVCNLESMGISTDARGHKYGYQVLKSVDVASFPPFTETVVVRAQMMLCCIFRQVEPNVVGFFSIGMFDLKGGLPTFIGFNTSADMVLSISKSVDCATAKRLTSMVLQRSERVPVVDSTPSSSPRSRKRSILQSDKDVIRNATCQVCARHPSVLGGSCRSCVICSAVVCGKCFVKAHVLATPHSVRAVCCISCVVKSREFPVDPREPYPLIELNEREGLR